MLFTVSLAFVVPLISAASLPVLLRPDSPDSNLALFQGRNTTSLTTSPVTPLNVAGRLNDTSSSIVASTTNSSSLGLVNAHAYGAPPRYPPGYPGRPYDYYVPYSQMRIHCTRFRPDPLQNDTNIDLLLGRLQLKYSDPERRSVPLWPEDYEYYWDEGVPEIGETSLVLHLPDVEGYPGPNITYGEFSSVLLGLNNLRHNYPMLAIDAEIYQEGDPHEMGLIFLKTDDPYDPDDVTRSIRQHFHLDSVSTLLSLNRT